MSVYIEVAVVIPIQLRVALLRSPRRVIPDKNPHVLNYTYSTRDYLYNYVDLATPIPSIYVRIYIKSIGGCK